MSERISAVTVIETIEEVSSELAAFVATLDPADHTKQSVCSEWSVAQVLSHLGSGAEISFAGLEAALTGTTLAEDFNQGVWARWDAMAPAEQVQSFLTSDATLVSRLANLSAAELATPIPLSFLPEPTDITFFSLLRLHELALHAWDVHASFDPDATVDAHAAGLLSSWPFPFMGHLAQLDASTARGDVALDLSDPEVHLGLHLGEDASLSVGECTSSNVLSMPAESWLRLYTGRLSPERTPSSVKLESASITLDDLRALFPGM